MLEGQTQQVQQYYAKVSADPSHTVFPNTFGKQNLLLMSFLPVSP